jgi:hypothetical protein
MQYRDDLDHQPAMLQTANHAPIALPEFPVPFEGAGQCLTDLSWITEREEAIIDKALNPAPHRSIQRRKVILSLQAQLNGPDQGSF